MGLLSSASIMGKNLRLNVEYMAKEYRHVVTAWWASGRTGLAKSDHASNVIHFTAPPGFRGLEGRWTPEDLLLCAIASCFTITFHALTDHCDFYYTDLQVEAEGHIKKVDSGYGFQKIVLRPSLTLAHEQDQERAQDLLKKANDLCLVSRAVSTPIRLEARVDVANAIGHRKEQGNASLRNDA
jgi:peroxiredoxin-like protein